MIPYAFSFIRFIWNRKTRGLTMDFNRPSGGLGRRLVIAFLIVVASAMVIPSLYNLAFLSQYIYKEAQYKMESDLEVATLLLSNKKQNLRRIGRSLASDIYFSKMVTSRVGNSIKIKVKDFLIAYEDYDLSYLTVTDSVGIVLCRYPEFNSTGDDMSAKASTRIALNGGEVVSFAKLDPEEMWRNGMIPEPSRNEASDTGLAIEATVPVFRLERGEGYTTFRPRNDAQGVVGSITVGYVLNRDRRLLREIHDRTRGVASVYFPHALVNSSDPSWNRPPPAGMFQTTDSWQEEESVEDRRRISEITGYIALLDYENIPIGVFELVSSTESINRFKQKSLVTSLLFVLLGMGVAVALGVLITRRITEPIIKLTRGAEEIGRGNLQHRIDIEGADELAELADSFNEMCVRLNYSMEEMRLSKQQVEKYSSRLKSAHENLEMYSKELEKVNQQLLDSNISLQKANEVKDTFLSTVSHELRTPLTSIIGNVSMMLEGVTGELSDDQRECLEVALRRGRNLQNLIADLLSLSRIDARRIELKERYIDPGKELRGVEEVFSERLKESQVELEIFVSPDTPRVYADRDRINQVLFNLVGNAIKFTPPGGRIKVQAFKDDKENAVLFSVSDTGIGIPGDELQRIFERFYQVDKHDTRGYGGTGLGLAICAELIALHGGRIWAESQPGRGSTFYFTLPLK